MRFTLLFAFLVACTTAAVAQKNDRVWHQDLESEVLDLVVRVPAKASPALTVTWQQALGKQGVRYVRLQFGEFQGDPGSGAELRVLLEPLGTQVASYQWKEMAEAGSSFMTGLLPAGTLRLQLVQGVGPKASSFKLVKLHSKTPRKTFEPQSAGVPRDMPLQSFAASHVVHKLAQSVAMLHIGPTGITCTGFLVAPGLLATNHHCITMSLRFLQTETQAHKSCSDILVEFDYVMDARGPTARCEKVEMADDRNDVALLRITGIPMAADGSDRAPLARTGQAGGPFTILHHPSGLPLAVEVLCNPRGSNAGDILHDCGTSPGSSGSAIFDDIGKVVGLHYKGAYPPEWTLDQVYEHRRIHGPSFNRAKPATVIQP
jgi:hypothetical protein